MTLHWPPVWPSLQVAALGTAGALVLGLWLAWRLATRDFTGRKALLAAVALFLAVPVVVLSWLWLRPAFPWPAAAAAGVLAALPVVVLGSRPVLGDLDRKYGLAARSLGCSEWRIFWRVMLPLGWRFVLAAAAIAFLRVWAEFAIVTAL